MGTAGPGHSSLEPLVGTVPHTLTSTHRNPLLDLTLASLLGFPEWQDLLHGECICAPRVLEKWTFLKSCLLERSKSEGLQLDRNHTAGSVNTPGGADISRCSRPAALLGSAVSWIFWDMFLLIRVLFVLWLM